MRLLKRREVEHKTGLSKSAIYERMQLGTFPRAVTLSRRLSLGLKRNRSVDCRSHRRPRRCCQREEGARLMLRPGEWPGRADENEEGDGSPPLSNSQTSAQDQIASSPPVALRGKMDPDGGGYIPENWQWFEILTEPHPLGLTDSRGQVRAVGRDPMTIPVGRCGRQGTAHGRLERHMRLLVTNL